MNKKIKQNKSKLIYSQAHVNVTDHHISGSSCEQISPARRTISFFRDNNILQNVDV